jgi:hypothetical protein
MQAAVTTPIALRPARLIPAARLERMRAKAKAAAEAREAEYQARQDAKAQELTPTPEYTPAPRLTMLPGGLHWSAQQVPAIGETVTINRDGRTEPVTVAAYCHAAGFLGLVTEPATPAKAPRRKVSPRAHCVFGYQLQKAA